jgi:hypothetical protein
MSVRSLSRALGAVSAAGALVFASSGAALAVPARPDIGIPGSQMSGSGNITPGTDVAAPDQQNPTPAPVKPKIAAPPTWAVNPQTLTPPAASSPSANTGFQWDDAGIGAGGALLVLVAGFGGVLAVRRRSVAEPPLAA